MQKGSDLREQGNNQSSGNKVGADPSSDADKARNFYLREEEEKSGSESGSESYLEGAPSGVNQPNKQEPAQSASSDSTRQAQIDELLEQLRSGQQPQDPDVGHETMSDTMLNSLNYKDFPKLRRAQARLHIASRDKNLDLTFRSRITSMVGTLNLYLDPELSYTWRQASLVVAKSLGQGVKNGSKRTRNIRTWIHRYLATGKLPCHRHGQYSTSILEHEDFAQDIKLHLMEMSKNGYIRAQDIVDYVATPAVQEKLGSKARGISLATANRWLKKLDWQFGRKKNGMYIDGHEHEDVVKYREEFLERWKEYEKRMVTYDNDGNIEHEPTGFAVPQRGRFRLILVTHDESTFYANDHCKTQWMHATDKATPQRKGEGPSIMISDMNTSEWGRLQHAGE